MTRSVLFAALLGSTMLSPRPAEAAPVVAFVGGALGVGASTALAATAAYASGAAFAGTLVGGFVVRTVVAIGLSALAAKLAPSPAAANASPIERMVNFAQPVSYAEWVYGCTRKGGPIGFTGFANDKRWYVPILAAHPIKGVVQHRLDERIVSLTDAADTNASNISESPIAGYGRVDVFTGDPGQAVHAGLDAAFAEITSEFDFEGLAGAVIWAARPPNESYTQVFPGGRQWQYSPVLDGKKDLYDPRDGQYKFSANAALVFADWCVNVMGREVDWDEIADEADACDLVEPDAAGIPRKRWELNGTLSDEQDYETHRAQLATACDAFVYDRTDGKVGFTVGRWLEPELTLGPDDFLSFEITEGQYGADAPDEVAALYTEPENGWRETPSGAWVARIAAKPVTDQPQIFMVTNHFQAARLNKRLARSKHAQYQLRGTIGMKGYEILGGRSGGRAHRFVRFVHPELGLDLYLEVGEMARESLGLFSLSANTVQPDDFAFTAAEEPARPTYEAVEGQTGVPVPSGFHVATAGSGAATFEWDTQSPAYLQDIRYRRLSVFPFWTQSAVGNEQTTLNVSDLASGEDYEVQIRNRSNGLGVSDWSASETFTA